MALTTWIRATVERARAAPTVMGELGILHVEHVPDRVGRNPQTGEMIRTMARTVLVFRCSWWLAARVRGDQPKPSLESSATAETLQTFAAPPIHTVAELDLRVRHFAREVDGTVPHMEKVLGRALPPLFHRLLSYQGELFRSPGMSLLHGEVLHDALQAFHVDEVEADERAVPFMEDGGEYWCTCAHDAPEGDVWVFPMAPHRHDTLLSSWLPAAILVLSLRRLVGDEYRLDHHDAERALRCISQMTTSSGLAASLPF